MSIESLENYETVEKRFICDVEGCGRVFDSQIALQGHALSHRPPLACPECGIESTSPGGMANHRKSAHGVATNGKYAKKNKVGRPPKSRVDTDLQVDHIFQSVVTSLWPGGTLPVEAIVPLMQWRDATDAFLKKVQSD